MFNELARLAQGSKAQQKTGTDTVVFKHPKALPSHKKATYARIVANYRPQKADPYRIRITVGGHKLEYAGEIYTPNADITTAKTLFNSVISTRVAASLASTSKISISELSSMTSNTCTFKNGFSNKNLSMKTTSITFWTTRTASYVVKLEKECMASNRQDALLTSNSLPI